MKLFVFIQTGCKLCEATKPAILAFIRKHPEVPVVVWDLALEEWSDKSIEEPETTPSFMLFNRGKILKTLTGDSLVDALDGRAPTVEDLERWALN